MPVLRWRLRGGADDVAAARRRQRIGGGLRPLRAFFRMPGAHGFGALVAVFAAIVALATVDLRHLYVNPETGKRGMDAVEAFYSVLMLLVFQPIQPLPASWLTRLAFFLVPLAGILVFGQGLVRLGASLVNREEWSRAMASTTRDHVVVCGLGRVSLKVVRWLLDLGEEVVVVERERDNPLLDEVRSWGAAVVIGDARRGEVLESAGLPAAESIVPCTSDDLTNLSIALEARRLVPGVKVVLRMADVQLAAQVRTGFDITTAFSIPELSAPAFAAAATKVPLDQAIAFGEGDARSLLTITKFTVVPESPLVGRSLGELERDFDVAVVALRAAADGRFRLHPPDEAVLAAGDRFVVSAAVDALARVARLTPPTREMSRYAAGRWPLERRQEH
jgi:Trk K+ transport system NAD-binding subunit